MFTAEWREALLANVVAACAILVAYLLTAATILPAIEDKSIVQRLRTWGYYGYVVSYIGRAALLAGSLLITSLAGIVLPHLVPRSLPLVNALFSGFWWGLLAATIIAVFIATRIVLQMIRAPK